MHSWTVGENFSKTLQLIFYFIKMRGFRQVKAGGMLGRVEGRGIQSGCS